MAKNKAKPFTGRDWALVRIIQGATKAGVHKDKKKEANKKSCRVQVRKDEQ